MTASVRSKRLAHMQGIRDRFQKHFGEGKPIACMFRKSVITFHEDVTLAAAFGRARGEVVEAWTWGRL